MARLDACSGSYTDQPAAQGKNAQRKRDLKECDPIDWSCAGHCGFLVLIIVMVQICRVSIS